MLIDVAIPGDRNVIKREAEKILKYKDLIIEFDVFLTVHHISSTNFNAQFSLVINNMFVTLLSSTCFEH